MWIPFKDQENCLTERNLNTLEIFLQNSVSVDPKPKQKLEAEIRDIPPHMRPYAPPADYLLSDKTISVCYDIGIYMGDLIISIDNKIKWELEKDIRIADYGQPVIGKKGNLLSLNPFRVTKNAAAKIYRGDFKEGQLIDFFNAWKKAFKVYG